MLLTLYLSEIMRIDLINLWQDTEKYSNDESKKIGQTLNPQNMPHLGPLVVSCT